MIETFAKRNLVYYRRWFSSHHLWSLYAAISSAEEQWPCKGKADVQFPLVSSAVTCAFVEPVFLSIPLPLVSIFHIYIFFLHPCWWTAPPPYVLVCYPVVCCHLCHRCVRVSLPFSAKYLYSVYTQVYLCLCFLGACACACAAVTSVYVCTQYLCLRWNTVFPCVWPCHLMYLAAGQCLQTSLLASHSVVLWICF